MKMVFDEKAYEMLVQKLAELKKDEGFEKYTVRKREQRSKYNEQAQNVLSFLKNMDDKTKVAVCNRAAWLIKKKSMTQK